MKGRKYFQTMSKPGHGHSPGSNVGQDLQATDVASGLQAARARNRLEHGTFELVVPMLREKSKRGNRKDLSTEAGHKGGTTRSSVEGLVISLEPRGRVIRSRTTGQPRAIGEGTHD